jgi:small subunit ribosomal protein S20
VANTKSAAKRAKQSERRRQHNVALRSRMRTAIKKVIKAIEGGDTAVAATAFRAGAAEVASMVNKGLTHRNKAARHKSRLNKAVKALLVKSTTVKSTTAKTATKSAAKKKTVKKK